MKRKTLLLQLLCGCFLIPAQAQLVNTGQVISVNENALLSINGNYVHESGAVIQQGDLKLTGDWINKDAHSAVFSNNSKGTVWFTGDDQHIGGSHTTVFPTLILTGRYTTLHVSTGINGILNLDDAELKVEKSELTILNTDQQAILRNSGFISTDKKGKLIRQTSGTGEYLFPMGSAMSRNIPLYRPLNFYPKQAGPNSFSATFVAEDPTFEGFDRSRKREDLQAILDKYFYIICKKDESEADIRFYLNTEEDGGFSQLVSWNQFDLWEKAAGTDPASLNGPVLSLSYTARRSFSNLPFSFANAANGSNADPLTIFNAFSPDGDGKNDTWVIKNIDLYPKNKLTIFNRWGDEVFRTTGYSSSNVWDGGTLNPGTYYYVLEVDINGKLSRYKGFVTMIKKD